MFVSNCTVQICLICRSKTSLNFLANFRAPSGVDLPHRAIFLASSSQALCHQAYGTYGAKLICERRVGQRDPVPLELEEEEEDRLRNTSASIKKGIWGCLGRVATHVLRTWTPCVTTWTAMCAAKPARWLGVCAELARRPGFGPSLRGLPSDCLASSTARRSLRVDDRDCLTPSLARRPRV